MSSQSRLPAIKSKYIHRQHIFQMFSLFLLGFSAGLPLLLIFSTLSLWLLEAGVERKMVTMFSWAALGYSFKFVWSPLLDSLPLPVLSRWLGQRRAWLLLAQLLMIVAVVLMAFSNPNPTVSISLNIMAFAALLLGFSSATQDVAIDAYRIEIAPNNVAMQSTLSAFYTAGYRVGMFVSGAGSLLLATYFGSSKEHYVYVAWKNTYLIMAGMMLVGVLTTLLIREPLPKEQQMQHQSNHQHLRLLLLFIATVLVFITVFRFAGNLINFSALTSPLWRFMVESFRLCISLVGALFIGVLLIYAKLVDKETAVYAWITPLVDFFQRYGRQAVVLLALIGLYRISDIVAGVISNVFYTDLGFSKDEIAWAVKVFGVLMSLLGGFAGGLLAQKFHMMKMMMFGAIAASLTNLLFVVLAYRGYDLMLMYTAVGLDNFAAGLAGTVFVAFLSSLTNIRFTAVQYALFSSLMTLFPKVLGGYSGSIVDDIGYIGFFTFTTLLGLPILILIWWADKILNYQNNDDAK